MSFSNSVLIKEAALDIGRVISAKPHCLLPYERFTNGLIVGRFVWLNASTGLLQQGQPNGAGTVAGVAVKKTTGEPSGAGVTTLAAYSSAFSAVDSVCEVCCFGYVTVEVDTSATIKPADSVYVGSGGRATNVPSVVNDAFAVFVEQITTSSWLICIKMITI
jgi:hypothetical protein